MSHSRPGRNLSRPIGIGAIGALLFLMLWGVLSGSQIREGFVQDDPEQTDVALYKAISARVADGDGYYDAVAVEQVRRGFPTSPAVTVREPTLAWLTSAVGPPAAYGVLLALAGIALVLSMYCLDQLSATRVEWVTGTVIAAVTIANLCPPLNVWIHDVWAGLLILIAGLTSTRRWFWPTLLALLAACLVRELALPAALAMAAVAWPRLSRRRRALSVAALLAFLAFYGWHVAQVERMVPPGSQPSPGWLDVNGWPFFVNATWFSTVLTNGPVILAALLVPVALLGWVAHESPRTRPVAVVLVVYAVVFSVIGRDNNLYWGALFGPLLLPGIAFAPRAVWRLARASRGPTRV